MQRRRLGAASDAVGAATRLPADSDTTRQPRPTPHNHTPPRYGAPYPGASRLRFARGSALAQAFFVVFARSQGGTSAQPVCLAMFATARSPAASSLVYSVSARPARATRTA